MIVAVLDSGLTPSAEFAGRLVRTLMVRDPLRDKVHLKSLGFMGVGMLGVLKGLWRRLGRRAAASPEHQGA